jgi:hypothetical protein
VWAPRSFTANWRQPIPKGKLFETVDFGLSRDERRDDRQQDLRQLVGRLHNKMPVDLTEVSLFFGGHWYALDDLPAGGFYRIDGMGIKFASGTRNLQQWMTDPFKNATLAGLARSHARGRQEDPSGISPATELTGTARLMKSILFQNLDADPLGTLGTSDLRLLDQSWRVRGVRPPRGELLFLDEAILVARAVRPPAPAEEVTRSGICPTLLWLGRLPGEGEREPLPGFLAQDTYVRIYIPVSAAR